MKSYWSKPFGSAILTVVLEVTNILSLTQPKRGSARTLIRTLGANFGENRIETDVEPAKPHGVWRSLGRMVHTPLMLVSLSASKSRCFAERSRAWVSTHFPVRPVKSRTGACLAPAAEISSRSV